MARRRWSGFEEPGAMARRLDPAHPMAACRMSYAPLSLLVAVLTPPLPPTPSNPPDLIPGVRRQLGVGRRP